MSYDMLTTSEKKWLHNHITGPFGRVVRRVPNLGRGCNSERRGYQLFDASGRKFIDCFNRALKYYFPFGPIKICRYVAQSEAGGWIIENLEATNIVASRDVFDILNYVTGRPWDYDWEFFVNDIKELGFGEYQYTPPGLSIETFDIPKENAIDRHDTKHLRIYIVPPDFNIEQIIDKKIGTLFICTPSMLQNDTDL